MGCLYQGTRDAMSGWPDETYANVHEKQSDPDFVKHEIRTLEGRTLHRLQTYRLAVRQGCRERGFPVRL